MGDILELFDYLWGISDNKAIYMNVVIVVLLVLVIREMLGHSSLQTTLSYIYNPLSEEETYNIISKAL